MRAASMAITDDGYSYVGMSNGVGGINAARTLYEPESGLSLREVLHGSSSRELPIPISEVNFGSYMVWTATM